MRIPANYLGNRPLAPRLQPPPVFTATRADVGRARDKLKGGHAIKVAHDTRKMSFGLGMLDKVAVRFDRPGDLLSALRVGRGPVR